MSRLIVALGVLGLAWSAGAKELDIVVRPWPRADAQLVATKSAADKATLARMRVEVAVVGDTMSIRFGEQIDGAWAPLPAGARIDLVLNLPSRLAGALPSDRPPVEPCAPPSPLARR